MDFYKQNMGMFFRKTSPCHDMEHPHVVPDSIRMLYVLKYLI